MGKPVVHMNPSQAAEETPLKDSFLNNSASVSSEGRSRLSSHRSTSSSSSRSPHVLSQALSASSLLRKKKNRNNGSSMQTTMMHTNSAMGIEMKERSISSNSHGSRSRSFASSSGSPSVCSFVHSNASTTTESAGNISPKSSHNIRTAWTGTEEEDTDMDRDIAAATATKPSLSLLPSSFALLPPSSTKESTTTTTPSSFAVLPPSSITTTTRIQSGCTSTCSIPFVCKTKGIVEVIKNNNLVLEENAYYGKNVHIDVDERIEITRQRTTASASSTSTRASSTRSVPSDDIEQQQQQQQEQEQEQEQQEEQEQDQQSLLMPSKKTKSKKTKKASSFLGFSLSSMKKKLSSSSSNKKNNKMVPAKEKAEATAAEEEADAEEIASQSQSPNDTTMDTTMDITIDSISSEDDCQDSPSVVTGYTDFEGDAFFSTRDGAIVSISNITEEQEEEEKEEQEKKQEEEEEEIRVSAARAEAAAEAGADTYVQFQTDDDQASVGTIVVVNEQQQQKEEPHSEEEEQPGYAEDNGAFEVVLPFQSSRSNVLVSDFVPLTQKEQQRVREHYQEQQQQQQEQQQQQGVEQGHEQPSSMFFAAMEEHLLAKKEYPCGRETPTRRNRRSSHTSRRLLKKNDHKKGGSGVKHDTIEVLHQRSSESSNDELDELVFTISAASSSDNDCCEGTIGTTTTTTTTSSSSISKNESVDTVEYGTPMTGILSPSLVANRVRRVRSIGLQNTGIEIPRIISTQAAKRIATTNTADDTDVDSVAVVPLEEKETTEEEVVAADQQPTQSQEEEEEEEKEEAARMTTTTTLRRVTTAVHTEVKYDMYDDDADAIEVEPSGTVQVVPQQRHQLSTTTVQQPYQLLRVVEDTSTNAVEVLRSRTMHAKLSTSCAKVVVPPSPSPSPSPIVTTTSTTIERESAAVAAVTTAVLGPRIRSCSSSQSRSRSFSRRPRNIRMVNEENGTNIELFRARTAATATTTTTTTTDTATTTTTDIATTDDTATISFDENEEDVIVQRIIAMAPEQEEEVHIVGVEDDTIEVIAVTSTSTLTNAENNTTAASTTTLSNVETSSVSSMVDFNKMIKEKVERQDEIVDTTTPPPASPTMVLPSSSSSEVVVPVTAPTTASSAVVSSVSPSGIRWDTTSSRRKEITKVPSSFEEYKKVEGERVSKVAVTAFDRAAVVKSIQKEDGAENDSALILLSQQTKQPQDEAMMSNTKTTVPATTTTTIKAVKIEPATATTPKNDDPRRHIRSTSATSNATSTATATATATPQSLFQRESSFLSKRKMAKKAATSLVPRLAAPKKDTVKVHHTTASAAAGTIPRNPNSLSKSRKLSYLRGMNNKNSAAVAVATATATINNEEEEQPKQVKIQVHSVKDTRNIKTIEVSPNTTTSLSSPPSAIVGGDNSKPSTSLAATTKSLISSLAKKKKKYPLTTTTNITDNKNVVESKSHEGGVAVVTRSEKSSLPTTVTAADTDDVIFPTVKHIVHVNVLGVAGIVVDRKSCKDVTGNQLSPGPPEQMKAVVGFKFLSTMDNVTSFSSTLIYSPNTKPAHGGGSSSGESVSSSSSMQRHIAVWTSNHLGETPGSVIESKVLETEHVDQQDPNSKYLPKFLDLNVALAKNSQDDEHVATVIGSATIKISDAMMRGGTSAGETIIMDLPVHQFEREGLSSSLNNRVITLQATTKRKGTRKLFVKQPDHCNNDIMNNKENLMSAYSIDPSGDSMIRVQVRVEQLSVDEEEKELHQQEVEMERIGSGTIGTEQSEGTSLSSGSRTASILPPAAAVCRVFDAFVPTRKSKKKKVPTGGPSGDELYSKSLEMPSRTTALDDDDTGTFHTVSWKGKLLARNHGNGNNAGGGEESGCKIFGKNVPMPSCSAESRMAVAKKIDDKIEDIADHVFEKVGKCPTQDGNDNFFCEDSSQNLDRSDTYDTYRTNFTGITGPTLFTTRTKEDNEDKEEQPITPQILFQEMKDFLGPVPTMDEVKKLAREIAETSGEYFFPEDPKVVANEENDENSSVGSATLQAFESGQLRMRSTDSRLLAKMNNRFPRHDDGRNGTTTTNNNNNNNSSSEEHFDTYDDLTYSTAGTFTSEPTLALNQPFGQEVEKKCSKEKDMPTENNNNEETGTIESYPTATLEDVGCEGDDEDEESTLVEERTALVDGDEEDQHDDDIINTKGRLPLEAEEDKPSLPSIVVGNIAEALSLGKACSYFGSKNHDQQHPGLVSPTMAWGGEGKSVPRTVEPSDILSVGELTAITLEKNEIRKRNRKLLLSRLSMPLRCTEVDVALDDDGNTIVGPTHSMLTFDDELDDTSVVEGGGGGGRRRKLQRRQPRENYFAEYEKDRTTSIDCPPQINNNDVVDNVLSNEKEIQTTTGSTGTSTTLMSPPPPPPPLSPPPPPLSPPPPKPATTTKPTTTTKASSESTTSTAGGEETTERIKATTTQNNNVAESLRTDEQHDLLLRIIEGDENEEEDGDTDCC